MWISYKSNYDKVIGRTQLKINIIAQVISVFCTLSTLFWFPILIMKVGDTNEYVLHSFWLQNTGDKIGCFYFDFFPAINTGCIKTNMDQSSVACQFMVRASIANTFLIVLLIAGIGLNMISIVFTLRVFKQKHYRFGNCVILMSAIAYTNSILIWFLLGINKFHLHFQIGVGTWLIAAAAILQLLCYFQARYFTKKLEKAEMILKLSEDSE